MLDASLDSQSIREATSIEHVEVHDSLGSTNDRAAELARDPNSLLPALIVARHQTAGRGRGNHSWWSGEGAIAFSVLLDPEQLDLAPSCWPQLSLTTAVAITDALERQLGQDGGTLPQHRSNSAVKPSRWPLRLGVKWPNDVYVAGRKIAGILLESPAGSRKRLIIGVGINVNNSWDDAPPGLVATGTSLRNLTGRFHDLQAVLADAVNSMFSRFAQLKSDKLRLASDWQQLNLLAEQNVVLVAEGRRIEGRCVAINDDGAIVVEQGHSRQLFYSGSIELA